MTLSLTPERFAENTIEKLQADSRILGLAVDGSWLATETNEYSELDLVVFCNEEKMKEVAAESTHIASLLGELLVAFSEESSTNSHTLICLYEEPLLRVVLSFSPASSEEIDLQNKELLWERGSAISARITSGKREQGGIKLQWMEDRFWIWLHDGALKLGRGELFELLDLLAKMRVQILGPLSLAKHKKPAHRLSGIEQLTPDAISELESTVAEHNAQSCAQALRAMAHIYVNLREMLAPAQLIRHRRAEMAAMRYFHQVVTRSSL